MKMDKIWELRYGHSWVEYTEGLRKGIFPGRGSSLSCTRSRNLTWNMYIYIYIYIYTYIYVWPEFNGKEGRPIKTRFHCTHGSLSLTELIRYFSTLRIRDFCHVK
jgi:hypothetical protein